MKPGERISKGGARVAIAGGFGFLGTNVTRELGRRGYEAVPFSRRSGVDIRDYSQVEAFLKKERCDVVINCAAHVGGIAYNSIATVEIFEDNLLIGFNLVRACAARGVRKLVNVMPNCTYPGFADVYREPEWWDGPMHDSVLTYGMPRKTMWVQAWAYAQSGKLKSIHLVLPNLYGPGDHFDPVRSHALGALVRKIVEAKRKREKLVEIWGTGSPVREWGFVEDAAEGVVIAMERYDDLKILNLGQGEGHTITAIAELIKEAVGWDGEFVYDTGRPDGAPIKILDDSRMHSALQWTPKTPLREGISRTVRWYTDSLKALEAR